MTFYHLYLFCWNFAALSLYWKTAIFNF